MKDRCIITPFLSGTLDAGVLLTQQDPAAGAQIVVLFWNYTPYTCSTNTHEMKTHSLC